MTTTKIEPQIIWAQPSAPAVPAPEPSLPRAWRSRRSRDFSAVNDTAKPSLCVTAASPVITLNPIMITSFYNMLWSWDQYIKRAECQLRSGQDGGSRAAARPRPLGQPRPACPGGGRGRAQCTQERGCPFGTKAWSSPPRRLLTLGPGQQPRQPLHPTSLTAP